MPAKLFEKGKSGNPNGRPKVVKAIQELAREHSEEAFNTIVHLSKFSDDERIRLTAADKIIERAWGKPKQELEVAGTNGEPLSVSLNVNLKAS